MTTERALAPTQETLLPIAEKVLLDRIETIRRITKNVMRDGVHFGTIPGTPKPSLLQPGAEILGATFGLVPDFTVVKDIEDFSEPMFSYRVRCELRTMGGAFAGSAEASWNSRENRYYEAEQHRYKEKIDPYNLQETGLMMARKRAFVAAIRTVTGASELFTQDLEDFDRGETGEAPMGLCPSHKVPFAHKQGTNKKTGRPYDFWACPQRDGADYCKKTPDDWVVGELKALGITDNASLLAFIKQHFGKDSRQEWLKGKTYAAAVAEVREALGGDQEGTE